MGKLKPVDIEYKILTLLLLVSLLVGLLLWLSGQQTHQPTGEAIKLEHNISSDDFTRGACKQLLKKWQMGIDEIPFRDMGIAEQATFNITDGRRYVTFVYTDDGKFEGCNILDSYKSNLDKKELEVEKYFNCGVENCKEFNFENGRFLYVYEPSTTYNTLKYLLRKEGKPGVEAPSLTFQILYIAKNMTSFIQYRIKAAERGFGCGT